MSAPPPRRRTPTLLWVLLGILGAALLVILIDAGAGAPLGIDHSGLGQLAALIAILIFVGAGILGRPLGAWQIVRSIITWAVIILVLAGVYASREQLTGFAGRLLGALAPGLPIAGSLTGDANPDTVAVVRSADGHFAVWAQIDDMPLTLLVDTGASFVTLTSSDARRIGIDPDGLTYSVPIRTANGTLTAAAITLGRVKVGPIERREVRALVAPQGSLEQSLLGMSYLNTLGAYSISGNRLVLTP